MAFKILSRLPELTRLKFSQTPIGSLSSSCRFEVQHDRPNHRFTVTADSGAGSSDSAVLCYRFTGEKEVELMSTYVPETFRGQGLAADLSRAALDFVAQENLKAHISCWYIKKYIEEHPEERYGERVIG